MQRILFIKQVIPLTHQPLKQFSEKSALFMYPQFSKESSVSVYTSLQTLSKASNIRNTCLSFGFKQYKKLQSSPSNTLFGKIYTFLSNLLSKINHVEWFLKDIPHIPNLSQASPSDHLGKVHSTPIELTRVTNPYIRI